MLLYFFDLFEDITTSNKKIDQKIYSPDDTSQIISLRDLLEDCKKSFDGKRECFYHTVDEAWNTLSAHSTVDQNLMQQVGIQSRDIAFIATRIAEQLYPYAGLLAAYPDSELNRVWRNMHTASQHPLLRFVME